MSIQISMESMADPFAQQIELTPRGIQKYLRWYNGQMGFDSVVDMAAGEAVIRQDTLVILRGCLVETTNEPPKWMCLVDDRYFDNE